MGNKGKKNNILIIIFFGTVFIAGLLLAGFAYLYYKDSKLFKKLWALLKKIGEKKEDLERIEPEIENLIEESIEKIGRTKKTAQDAVKEVEPVLETLKSRNIFGLKNTKVSTPKKQVINLPRSSGLNERQKVILKIAKKQKEISFKDVKGKVRNVTTRTIRRDFSKLESEGILRQIGKTKDSRYVLVSY